MKVLGYSETGAVNAIITEGVTIRPYSASLHNANTVSHDQPTVCAQGGQDTCPREPMFSVFSNYWGISACPVHVLGAAAQAHSYVTAAGAGAGAV